MAKKKVKVLEPVSPPVALRAPSSDTGRRLRGPGGPPAGRRMSCYACLLRGESLEAVSREVGVELYRLEQWRGQALAGMDAGLRERGSDPVARDLDAAKRQIGERVMQVEILKLARELPARPLTGRRLSR